MSSLSLAMAKQLVERLKLFAQPQRLMILDALLDGPLAVSELESRTGIGQPTLSQQLGTLRRASVILPRRESRAIYYSLANDDEMLRARALIGLLQEDRVAAPLLQKVSARRTGSSPGVKAQEEGGAQFAFIRSGLPSITP
ncbi:metalloregulator ArsR/SmtB family transcription factor [Acetobacter farinalis]|uniref:Metalloregulator ArsR/SmtB family transcription factor n=1 Tax=Acetobacter farinalis TaxID=1260984 RepID=A0ABT3Q617_9PROT|nr:metalloregulator ArsR/SmtB family transcription factor [Acetobacter farinalis]MCX2560739.1 metalloregulator ArsR/SmtB family transcription factor [Acetobacter farinalis]NHO29121.1 metalloregulator ArsR/SmtB family transcription factor [Acetobacter farinalis]